MNSQPKKAFSLIELLVVIAVIAVLMAIGLPSLRAARQSALETTCKSNLRQMGLSLNAYTADNDTLFPNPSKIYHSALSFGIDWCKPYYSCCRWHDARMGFGGPLLTEHPELQGSLYAYIGNKDLLICKVGKRANDSRGCWNTCSDCGVGTPCYCRHDGTIPVDTQYTYTMNSRLHATLTTVLTTGPGAQGLDNRTKRKWPVRQPTQVTRSPSEIFAFGEQNSWASSP